MYRLLNIFGILLLLVGIIGGIAGAALPFINPPALNVDPQAMQDLCGPGERVVEETGSSSYTPGMGYGSTAMIYCVNDAGDRRLVTGDFVQRLFGNIPGFAGGLFASIGLTTICFSLVPIGVIMIVFGLLLNPNRRRVMALKQYYTVGGTPIGGAPVGGTSIGGMPVGFGYGAAPSDAFPIAASAGGDASGDPFYAAATQTLYDKAAPVANRLQALETAYQGRLVTPDQYERMKAWLNNM